MLYRPKLTNGKYVQLSWPIALYRRINNICWPLEDEVSRCTKIFDRCCYILFLVIYLLHLEAEFCFLIVNRNDLDQFMEGIIVYVVQLELALRTLQLGLRKQQFREFLQNFYADVYIQKSTHPHLYRSIKKKLRPTIGYSFSYLLTLILYAATPFISLVSHRRDLAIPMIVPFDITPVSNYTLLACSSTWLCFIVVSMLFGDANVMSEAILHLHAQYLLLDEDLQRYSKELLQQGDGETISRKFSEKVKHTIQRSMVLRQFGYKFQKFYSYRVFLMYSFAAIIMCALGYKTYTVRAGVLYNFLWMLSKVMEMLALGQIGSNLIVTSNSVSSIYYNSNWELIISCSTNAHENVRLMKLLTMAIGTNKKPFVLNGFGFFDVSLTTVMKILQAAASYFTCLISFREN